MKVSEFRNVFGNNADYWGEGDKGYPLEDWRSEVQDNNTRLGYWDWVFSCQ